MACEVIRAETCRVPDNFFLAFDASMREFARTRSEEFLALIAETGNPDSKLLQRLMCRGVRELAVTHPIAALEFLTADPRRFWLGGMHDDHGDSAELIIALAPHLSDDQLAILAAAICNWKMYRDGGVRMGNVSTPGDIVCACLPVCPPNASRKR